MIEKNLSKLGLSPSEIKVYLHLLKNGCSYPNRISSELRINRSNIYEALDRLVSKGIISFIIKNNIKWFEAKDPENLIALIHQKEEELSTTKINLKKDIKNIKKYIDPDDQSLEAKVFTGKKGLRMLFEDTLSTKKQISLIASELQFKKIFGPYFELWHKKRISSGIKQRSIFPEKIRSKLKKRRLLEYKFIDNNYANPTTTIIYGDSCIFIQWSKEPIAIKVSNKEITKSHLNYFNMLWNS